MTSLSVPLTVDLAEPPVVLHARGIGKIYAENVKALDMVSLQVRAGERVAIWGASGAGKSTLLNILGLLDDPTSGSYELLGKETTELSARAKDQLRSRALGFVFQAYHILGHRTVAQNVALKLTIAHTSPRARKAAVHEVIDAVGLTHRKEALGSTLSGGEKQRLAIARAIVAGPAVVLADEPTGNLDRGNASVVLDLFNALATSGVAVVVITHDDRTATWADRQVELLDGHLQDSR